MKAGSLLLGISFFLSKILGLARDHLLASQFGAGDSAGIFNLDTYYAAFRVPDFLFNLLSYGVLGAAFVPLFIEIAQKEGKPAAYRFTNQILHTIGILIVAISALLFVFAPQIVDVFLPGFSSIDIETTVDLTRLMLVTPILFTIGSIASGIQNAENRYLGLSVAPLVYNIGIIAGIMFLSDTHGVYGVAIGVVSGAVLHLAVQLVSVYRTGFRYLFTYKLWSSRVKEMIYLSLPRIFGMSVTQLSLVADTIIASTLASGSVTVINFASNLESLPIGVIGISVAIVSFGKLSSYSASGKISDFMCEIKDGIRKILFFLIPLAAGMFTLRFQIVRLVLGRGQFDWDDTTLTANTLGIFLVGLIFGGTVFLLARGFYALKNTKTPVIIGIIAVIANIALSLIFTKLVPIGPYGLALANSVADIINATLLLIFLNRTMRANLLDTVEIGKFIISAALMALAVQLTKMAFGYVFLDIDTYAELILQTGTASIAGVFVYFGMCWILRCREVNFIYDLIFPRS